MSNERHPDALDVDAGGFNRLMLDAAYRRQSDGFPAHDGSDLRQFHNRCREAPRGVVLADLHVGDIIRGVHDCGPVRLRYEHPAVAICALRWWPGSGSHLVQVIDADWNAGWFHAGDLGLEEYGGGFTTVDVDERSPTYMTEIVHPMCERWSGSNYSDLITEADQ